MAFNKGEHAVIHFEKAKIIGNAQVSGLTLINKLRVVSLMTAKAADELGARWLVFDREAVIRSGFTSTELDAVFLGATFVHEVEKIGKLELVGCDVGKFKAFRTGDGKKKPRRLMLAFTVTYRGGPFDLQEHLIKCGRGEGACSVAAPQQEEMFKKEAAKQAPSAPDPEMMEAAPLVLIYFAKSGWAANVTVAEVAEGFEMTRRAASPTKKLKQGPPVKYASESEAREEGARQIQGWAEKIAAGGTRPEKREAQKLAEWAAEHLAPLQSVAPSAVQPVYPD